MNAVFTKKCCSLGGCTAKEKWWSEWAVIACIWSAVPVSGEMAAAALLDLGADQEELQRMLHTLPLKEFQVEIGRASSCGVMGCCFQVTVAGGQL